MKNTANVLLTLLLLSGLLVACTGDNNAPLVQVATPDAPDAGFHTYDHQTGVFSIRVPPAWIPDQLPDENGIRTQFTSVEGNERAVRLTVYVVNTGQPLTQEAFMQAVNDYQPPEDLSGIPWTPLRDPEVMADGSIRLTGIRHYSMLGDRAMNIFLQSSGSYFTALEADVTNITPSVLEDLMAAINTYRINTNAPLTEGSVISGGVVSESGSLLFQKYAYWLDTNGGFNITGEVVNLSENPLEAIRLTAYLYDEDGNQLAERSDILPYDVLASHEAAPFRIRFDTGRPSTAVRYEIHAAARNAEFSAANFYGNENFLVQAESDWKGGYITITGAVQNNGLRLATSVEIIATILNPAGEIVGVQSQIVNKDQLLPNEATDFEITFYDIGGEPFSFNLIVQGTVQETPQ